MNIADCELRIADLNPSGVQSEIRNPQSDIRHAGQLLLVVLWVMGLVSVAVGSLALRSDHALRLGRIPLEALQRQAVAQAAVAQAAALLLRDDPAVDHLEEPWATGEDGPPSSLAEVAVGQGVFSIGVTDADGAFVVGLIDEERKLNLRAAAPSAFQQLLELLGVNGSLPHADIAAALADWQDEPIGPWCDEQQLGYACRNGTLQTLDELRLVPGMTPELFSALAPYVTVYGNGGVNANTAPSIVLSAIGCPGEDIVQQRATPFTAPPVSCPQSVVTSTAFTVPVEAWLSHSPLRLRLRAVVHRNGAILAWHPE